MSHHDWLVHPCSPRSTCALPKYSCFALGSFVAQVACLRTGPLDFFVRKKGLPLVVYRVSFGDEILPRYLGIIINDFEIEFHVINGKNTAFFCLGFLGYIGEYTTQLSGDCNKINKPI